MKTKLTLILLIAGFLCAQSQTWTWLDEIYLSSGGRTGLSATVMDDSIFYSAGRITNYSYPGIIDIYDIGEEDWDTYEPESPDRWITSAVSTNGMVFFAGGNNYDPANPSWTFFSEIDVFTKETGEWTIDYLSEGRQQMGTVASGNKVFFAGGISAISTALFYHDTIDIYDTETKTWLPAENLSIPRCLMGAVAACGKVFFAGGAIESGQVTDRVDIYDTETGEWTIDYLSDARACIAAVAYQDKVYFAGGTYANKTGSDVIDIYNCEDGTWEDSKTLSEPRVTTAYNVYNALVFTGMYDYMAMTNYGAGPPNGVVDIYYPETGNWDLSLPDLNPARYFCADASYENKIFYAGGSLGPQVITDIINILEYTPCFPDDITITTQEEIDNFPTNHPYCSYIGGDVEIDGDDIINVDGLSILTSIGGYLDISDNPNLTSLTGLVNLTSIGGELIIDNNDALESLSGIDNIDTASIVSLNIEDNNLLSFCNIQSVCDYVASPDAVVVIQNNATGCNNPEEACNTSVWETGFKESFTISPNPLSGSANLQFVISDKGLVNCDLFEVSGVKVKSLLDEKKLPGIYEMEIDLSDLPKGIYFCILKTSDGIHTKKIIKL